MFIVHLHLTVSPEKQADVIRTFQPMIEPTLALPACLKCGLFSDVANDDRLIFIQQWESREGLERHLRSEQFLKVLACMDMAVEKPELVFQESANTHGLGMVEQVRGGEISPFRT